MAKIIIPTPLRKFTQNKSTFDASGSTVKEAVAELINAHSEIAQHILDDDKNIRSFIRIYVGEDDIDSLQKEETAVAANTVISIVPAIAGGAF